LKLPGWLFLLLILSAGCTIRIPLPTPSNPNAQSPKMIRFFAEPQVIAKGEAATLHWEALNATEVLLEKAADPHAPRRANFEVVGRFAAKGALEVRPEVSTVYVVSCGDEVIGCSSASVRVKVK
jgi:hypothetical protein